MERDCPEDNAEGDDLNVADEAKLAPWRLTENFVDCMQGKCLLAVTGNGDPTGEAQMGFSYLRMANKPVTVKKKGKMDKLLPDVQLGTLGPDGKKSDDDKDLRKLNLKDARELLSIKYGHDMAYLKTLKRWRTMDLVK